MSFIRFQTNGEKQGWTFIEKKVRKETIVDALTTAYCLVAPKRLARTFLDKGEIKIKGKYGNKEIGI